MFKGVGGDQEAYKPSAFNSNREIILVANFDSDWLSPNFFLCYFILIAVLDQKAEIVEILRTGSYPKALNMLT